MKTKDNFKYDLAVGYRIYPKVSSHAPPIYADDKLKLSQLCLESFKQSLGDLKVKLFVLLDGCPPVYEEMFQRLWPAQDLELKRFSKVGDASTFMEQARTLMEQSDAEVVYLAEDDYFYLPNEFALAVRFLTDNTGVDFISVYNHPDTLSTALHDVPFEEKKSDGKTWRTCMSTTHTFLTTRTTLRQCKWVFLASYGRVSPDLSKWMALTKTRVWNPFFFARALVIKPFWAASVFFAWWFCWRQILFGRKYRLWIPEQSIGTHMVAGMEAPGVDWQKFISSQRPF